MHLLKEIPATLAACGAPVVNLAAGKIDTDFIRNLPPIQADPRAELRFARQLAAAVFGKSSISQIESLTRRSRIRAWRAGA